MSDDASPRPGAAETPAIARNNHTRRNVVLLAAGLALSMSGGSLVMTVTALTGTMLAPRPELATLPLTVQFILTMAATIPASMFMRRFGRRIGFSVGQLIGVIGALVSCYAIFVLDFWLFAVGGGLIGAHNAFWQYYRFAAADTASADYKSRAISYVMAGGVAAAVLGPELAKHSRDLFEPILFAGSYAVLGLLCLLTVALLQFIRIPDLTVEERKHSGRPLRVIARQPVFIIAVLSAMLGYAVMSLVMTATPLAMVACGHDFADTALVIQWHVLGMTVPSFFTGHLVRRFGALTIIKAGALLNLGTVVVGLSGIDVTEFFLALLLLGVGWNFMFVGGTTLLTDAYTPTERNKVQALNDFLVFGLVSVASLAAGAIQNLLGWQAINLTVIAPMLIAFLAALWLRRFNRQNRAAA
ncbi:MAG: MFS transporter [Alphaproteobacteria bacterium]|jgi:MFS family permease|nr:MFS transporter [Alphaproteobacteria bacterium]